MNGSGMGGRQQQNQFDDGGQQFGQNNRQNIAN